MPFIRRFAIRSVFIIILIFFVFDILNAFGDTIIDNGDPETSFTGTWNVSSGVDPYAEDSLWSRDGATYTWTFIPTMSGLYEVSMWWTIFSSRSTNVPILIDHAGGRLAVSVDQQENPNQWNPLGQLFFEADIGYDITITAQVYPSSTSADAVKFVFLSENSPPAAVIDMISPNPALSGDEIVFSGSGTDLNGSIADYSWRSSIDGQLSNVATFNTSDLPTGLSEGIHTIYFKVQDNEGTWSPEQNAILVYRSCSSPIKIMPLGNSITYDTYGDPRPNGLRTGYRQPLWSSLEDEGYNMDFVGSFVAGDEATPFFDPDNDGHPGWRDNEIANGRSSDPGAGKLADWLIDHDPDIVLLHIGTNGLDPSPSDVENILNIIDAYSEEIIVILARIINRNVYSQMTTDFNDNVQAMAEARISIGDKIVIVDMEDGARIDYRLEANAGNMVDNLHPNDSGYAKMAVIWFDALINILPPCAEFAPFIFTHPNTTGEVGQSYTYQVGAIGNPQPTFSLLANPAGMSIDSITGLIQWTPNSGQEGGHIVSVQAQSAEGTYTQTYSVEAMACVLDPKFQVTTIRVSEPYYTDRSYTITGGVPSWMVGRTLIQTPNNERFNNAASGYLHFTTPVSWWVYVLFDSRASNKPDWLDQGGWVRRSNRIFTSLSSQPYLEVWRKMFTAGQCVDLGGNFGPGSSGENRSNYAVVYGAP